MHRVIVKSTPLIILCNIGELDILKELYGKIVIPQAVRPILQRMEGKGFYISKSIE